MADSMPYSDLYHPYVTPASTAGCDPHVDAAGEAYTYGSSWYGAACAPSTSTYPYISSVSSLAGALDPRPSPPAAAPAVWPESEAFPIAPLAGSHHELGSTQGYAEYTQYDVYAGSSWDQEMLCRHQEGSTFATDDDAMQTEQGYFYGQDVPTGTVHPPVPSSIFTSDSLVLSPPLVPFTPTRSYTLEGAVTPVVRNPRPVLPPVNTATTSASPVNTATTSASPVNTARTSASPSVPSPSASDAASLASPRSPPQSPVEEVKQEALPSVPVIPAAPRASTAAAATAVPPTVTAPPPVSQPQAALMTKFSTKPPFRHVAPPKPSKAAADVPPPAASSSSTAGETRTAVEGAAAGPKKKPAMACLFCRERKICCGPPAPDSTDARCKQCIKRGQSCTFPTECRRGQHKRTPRKATIHALAAATFPDDEILADVITKTGEQPVAPVEPAAGPSTSSSVQPKAVTQKIKAAAKRGRKLRVKPLEGVSKILDKPIVSSPTSLSPTTPTF